MTAPVSPVEEVLAGDFKIGQDFVTKVTSDPNAPDVSVIGPAPPMPTDDEMRAAHKTEYVRLFVEIGVPAETAADWHDEQYEDMKDDGMSPQEAFDSEVSYWDNDGDLA